jgi:hypothetical protein
MNNSCICWLLTHISTGDFNFKGLTARRLYKSFGVKGLIIERYCTCTRFQKDSRISRQHQQKFDLHTTFIYSAIRAWRQETKPGNLHYHPPVVKLHNLRTNFKKNRFKPVFTQTQLQKTRRRGNGGDTTYKCIKFSYKAYLFVP